MVHSPLISNKQTSEPIFNFELSIDLTTPHSPQWWSEIIETSAKNSVVPVATSNVKLFLKDHMVRLKIISLYVYKDLRLKTYDLKV